MESKPEPDWAVQRARSAWPMGPQHVGFHGLARTIMFGGAAGAGFDRADPGKPDGPQPGATAVEMGRAEPNRSLFPDGG